MKGFLRKVLLIASFGAALTFYGCNKDYGQDISELSKALEEQKATLTAAIEQALADAKTYADNAAKQAASEVKAEMLTEIQNQIDAAKKYTDDEIAKISGRIDGIDEKINTINATLSEQQKDIAALEKLATEIDNRVKTLEAYKDKLDQLDERFEQIDQTIADLKALKEDLGDLDALIGDGTLADLLKSYEERLDGIDAKILEIDADLLSIYNMIENRLTSISLIPEVYFNGVPAMKLDYIGYNAWILGKDESYFQKAIEMMLPAVEANQFRYNVSPSSWAINSIGDKAYVLESAEEVILTKAYEENTLLNISSIEKNKRSELVANVRVKNGNAWASFEEQANTNKLITAALQLGIADEYLTDNEKESKVKVNVTSEYSVIGGNAGEVHIAPATKVCRDLTHERFFTAYIDAQEGAPTYKEVYNTTIDLLDSVRICVSQNGKLYSLNAKDLAGDYSYLGLSFKFAIPETPFVIGDNDTDQQDFIKFVEGSNSAVQSVVPGGATNNEAAIGKSPIVRVELVASNGDIVDVQWIKILWVREKVQDWNLGDIFEDEYTLSCKDFSTSINWSTFIEKILSKIGENGMSYVDFYTYYNGGSIDIEFADFNFNDEFTYEFNFDQTEVDPKASAITINITSAGFYGVIYDILKSEDKTASYKVKFTLTPADTERHGKITFVVTINVVLPEDMPSFHGQNLSMNWTAENLAAIHPVGYSKGTAAGASKVYYEFPMNDLFTTNSKDNLFVDNIYDCRAWDMQFGTESTIDNFKVHFAWNKMNALFAGDENGTGYIFSKNNGSFAARLVYGGVTVNGPFTNWYTVAEGPQKIDFALADVDKFNQGDAAAAKELLNDVNVSDELRKVIPVNIWSRLSENNEFLVKAFNVWVVSPVSVPDPKFAKDITDVNKDKIEVMLPISYKPADIKDFQNKTLNNADELSYYGVYGPVWDIDESAAAAASIYTNVVSVENNWDVDENVDPKNPEDLKRMKTLADLGIEVSYDSASGKLVFTNISTHLVKDIKLYFNGTYGHKFADNETWGTINFKKNDGK